MLGRSLHKCIHFACSASEKLLQVKAVMIAGAPANKDLVSRILGRALESPKLSSKSDSISSTGIIQAATMPNEESTTGTEQFPNR